MKTITLIIALAFSFSLALAQSSNTPPEITWQKCLGGSNDDKPNCVLPTQDGGFIVAGVSNSTNGDVTGNHGQGDFWIVKLDAAGSLVWQHSYGGTGVDEPASVIATLDGGYAVAGKSTSHNGDVTGNHGGTDVWLIKTNDLGIMQWQKSYGGSLDEAAYSIQPASDSGFVISGITYSNDGDVSGNHGMADAWIIRLNQDGILQWQTTVGGSKSEKANDIKQSAGGGGYFVTGYSLSNDGDIATNKGQEDFLFFKLDANGNLQWEKTMGGTGGDVGSAGVQTIDGGYAICGLTHSRDSDVAGNHGAHDMWVIKTSSTGVAQWTHCLGGSSGDNGFDIRQQDDGTIIACAYTSSNDSDVTGNHGLHDIWLTALDTSGNLLWQKTLGGSNEDIPQSMQIISAGQYIVAGRTKSNDGDVSGNHGNYDFWIVRLSVACNNVFYADADGDGFGDLNSVVYACSAPSGYVADHTDCNDSPSNGGTAIHSGASDVCNGIDDNCNGTTDENAITATLTPSGTVTICDGSYIMLTANGGAGITYQWIKGTKNISGETNATYKAKKAAKYKVSESNSFGCSSVSAVTTVNVNPSPAAIITYTTLDLCGQSSITLTANSETGLTYQWIKAGANITGATNQTYSATAKATYKVVVTNSYGCSGTSSGKKVIKSCKESSEGNPLCWTQLDIYPNPNSGHFNLTLQTGDDSNTEATLEVFNQIGQRVYRQVATVNAGIISEEVQLPGSATAGIYLVKVVVNDQVYTSQISYQK